MSSLPPPKQSSAHPQARQSIDDKYNEAHNAALEHMKSIRSRKIARKASPIALSSPPLDDFVLFPDNDRRKQRPSSNDSAQPRKHNDSMEIGKRDANITAAMSGTPTKDPRRRNRTPRHGGFKVVNISDEHDDNDDAKRKDERPPPAPLPPKLNSPDISDVDDEEFWGCCHRGEHGRRKMGIAA